MLEISFCYTHSKCDDARDWKREIETDREGKITFSASINFSEFLCENDRSQKDFVPIKWGTKK